MPKHIEFNIPGGDGPTRIPLSLVVGAVLVVVLLIGGFSAVYTVPADSQGVVLRFGRYVGTTEPGLRVKAPFGIDQVFVVPVRRQLKQEFGFATEGGTNLTQFASFEAERERERRMVTGDLNAATVEWIIQYRIRDPHLFLFKVVNPESTLRDISESVMRAVIGDRTVDEVITIGRTEIEDEGLLQMQEVANLYQLGLAIDQVQLKDVNPPRPVQASFNEVNQAQQERERMINEANGQYNKVIPRARGRADQQVQSAEGYALKRVNEAQGDANRFEAILEAYLKSPDVTRRRLYLETMQEVVPKLGEKIVIDRDASQILPLLQLNQAASK